jgi:hypothetical protein
MMQKENGGIDESRLDDRQANEHKDETKGVIKKKVRDKIVSISAP